MLKNKVKYFNSYAEFFDSHTLKLDNGKGKIEQKTADKIVIQLVEDHPTQEFQETKNLESLQMICSP
jgi:hypothetical protein